MKQSSPMRRGFTLIELLVVIGIIAVLLSVLLPTLRGVRRQANLVQCSSNMRQVATALILYIHDNKGRHPPAGMKPMPPMYPRGWWFANELVRQNYIKTASINVYKKPFSTLKEKKFNRANPFRCPEGIDEDYALWGDNVHFPDPDFPTDAINNGYTILNDPSCATDGFGVPSWYQLNSKVQASNNGWPGGSSATPFVWFNSDDATTIETVKEARYARNNSFVKRSAEMVMLAEAPNPNWHDGTESKRYPGNFLTRLAARHGKKTIKGDNAWTNMAFFDGHVSLYPTADYQKKGGVGTFNKGTIFYLGKQQK
jgi:prepilin-type N-terminal cleavage/methylation domain-containing protein/prepilin-type processing-associated H-X9-DG protein